MLAINHYNDPSIKVVTPECPDDLIRQQCWEYMINETLNKNGLTAAFEVLASLYAAEPAFAKDCHSYVHELGKSAYESYSESKSIELSDKSSYCGYGFYHGFMEYLLLNGGSLEEARNFCKTAGEMLIQKTSDAEGACYHGIGHGAVDGSDPRAWGNPQAVVAPGIKLCEAVATDPHMLYRCVTGAYNSLEILSGDPKYKLESLAHEPFDFCKSQKEIYMEGCYSNMIPAVMRKYNDDINQAIVREVLTIKGPNSAEIIRSLTEGLMYELVRMNLDNESYLAKEALGFCRSYLPDAHSACIRGISGGLMKYGQPGQEYVKALGYCENAPLTDSERKSCYGSVLTRLRIWYSQAKSSEICSKVDDEYRSLCY